MSALVTYDPLNRSVFLSAGMTMGSVSRLKKTWGKVKTACFDILEVRVGVLVSNSSMSRIEGIINYKTLYNIIIITVHYNVIIMVRILINSLLLFSTFIVFSSSWRVTLRSL